MDFPRWFGFFSKWDQTFTKEFSTWRKSSRMSIPETSWSSKSRPKSRPKETNSWNPTRGFKDNFYWSTQETLSSKEPMTGTGTVMSKFNMKNFPLRLMQSRTAKSFRFSSPRLSTHSSPSSSLKIRWNKQLRTLKNPWPTQQKIKLF